MVTSLINCFVDIFCETYFLFNNYKIFLNFVFFGGGGGVKKHLHYSYKAVPFPIKMSIHLYRLVLNCVLLSRFERFYSFCNNFIKRGV